MNHIFSVLLAVASLSLFSCSQAQDGSGSQYQSVNAEAFEQHLQEQPGTILDVRTDEEVSNGIIEGALHINIHDADFATRAASIDKSKPVYVYCAAGGRSSRACKQLIGLGFTNVFNLEGGITGWQAANKPVVKP